LVKHFEIKKKVLKIIIGPIKGEEGYCLPLKLVLLRGALALARRGNTVIRRFLDEV
jgi:hypothetical protein